MSAETDRAHRVTVVAARLLAVLAGAAVLVAATLPLLAEENYLSQLLETPDAVIALSFPPIGALLVGRVGPGIVPWLLLAIGLSSATFVVAASATGFALGGDLEATPASVGAGTAALAWLSTWTWLPQYLLILTVLPHLLPDGRVLDRWWRIPVVAALVVLALMALHLATEPGPLTTFPGIDNPLGWPAAAGVLGPVVHTFELGVVALALAAVVSVVVRVVRSGPAVRRQLGWVGYAVAAAVVLVLALGATDLPGWLLSAAVAMIPLGIAVAVLRYRLYDLDLVVNRTIVAGVLVGGAALTYAAVVGWLGALLDTGRGVTSFLAAFVLALAFHPARILVQQQVDRLFFGRRGSPLALLADVDRALRTADSPRRALDDAVAVVRAGLKLSGAVARVRMPSGETVVTSSGDPSGAAETLALQLHGQLVGELVVGSRARDAGLSGTDHRVLATLAGPLAAAAYALRLSGDLEESRTRIIEAREEERRRLRRDLHDGLGPQLAGVVMGLDSIRAAITRGNPDRAVGLAKEVGDRARTAVEDVRRLVAGLRPPVLDDLGLIGALRSTVPVDGRGGPAVTVTAGAGLPALPAAVEVAAYRIVSEAITNAVRHAGAGRVEVVLDSEGDALKVQVTDDGRGLPETVTPGVGLASMGERAAELGGWCRVVAAAPRGTTVLAHLPLGAAT